MPGISPWPLGMTQGGANSSATLTGDVTMMSDGVNPNFVIPHTVGTVPRYANVVAKNENAIGKYSVMWDANNITIMYDSPPQEGDVELTWIASK